MTAANNTPDPSPGETPTAPLPPTPETAEAPPVMGVAGGPVPPAHGLHGIHRASDAAIALMIGGALLFAVLAFGVGWTARGAALRFQAVHGGYQMGQSYGLGRGHGMRGFGGKGQLPLGGRGYGHGFRGGMGQGQVPGGQGYWGPNTSTPPTGTLY